MNGGSGTDVLIIGFGGAGAAAAITAREAGAEVLIVEKMERGGGNTNVSLGGFLSPTDLGGGWRYLENLCFRVFRAVDPEMVRVYAEECMRNREWFEKRGAKTHVYGGASFPQLPGAEFIEKRMVTGKNTAEENSFVYTFKNLSMPHRFLADHRRDRCKVLVD